MKGHLRSRRQRLNLTGELGVRQRKACSKPPVAAPRCPIGCSGRTHPRTWRPRRRSPSGRSARTCPSPGWAAWPPTPCSVMVMFSLDAMNAPLRNSRCPGGWPGMLCMAKMASHGKRSNRPSSIILRAPPRPSSAGWKMRLSVPLNCPCLAKWCAAASSMAVWPSWPHACISPAWQLAWSRPVASVMGSASMSARRPRRRWPVPRRSWPTTPVPPRPRVTA